MKHFEHETKKGHVKIELDVESPRETVKRYKAGINRVKNKLVDKVKRRNSKPKKEHNFIDIEIEKSDGTKKEYKL